MKSGKKVCNELKEVRKQIAIANGIKYNPTECTHTGDCLGTCAKCEEEVKYIENELNLRRMLGKAVIVTGLGLSVASCVPGCSSKVQGIVPGDNQTNVVDSNEIVLMGEVPMEVDSITNEVITFPQIDDFENK